MKVQSLLSKKAVAHITDMQVKHRAENPRLKPLTVSEAVNICVEEVAEAAMEEGFQADSNQQSNREEGS